MAKKTSKKSKPRVFERHPGELPIRVKIGNSKSYKDELMNNISLGGMSFKSKSVLKKGTLVKIKAKVADNIPEVEGIVAWSKKNKGYCDIGVEFSETEAKFGVRILEQLYNIENYKKDVKKKEGRVLTGEQAALEWIRKYAGGV
ncbi:PilZ domain-containing protein [Elusimicrobiota bacterium]